jgi:DNA gyrase/topoisomerase IV subunit B
MLKTASLIFSISFSQALDTDFDSDILLQALETLVYIWVGVAVALYDNEACDAPKETAATEAGLKSYIYLYLFTFAQAKKKFNVCIKGQRCHNMQSSCHRLSESAFGPP